MKHLLFLLLAFPAFAGFTPYGGSPNWKWSAANSASLPVSGNVTGDCRVAIATTAIYCWSGSAWVAQGGGGGGGSPGGISGDIQYNDGAGGFGGDPFFFTDGNGTVHAEELGAEFVDVAQLRIDGAGIATIKMSQGSATTYNFNMPDDAGTLGYFLTSGGGGSTKMSWTAPYSYSLPVAQVATLGGVFSKAVVSHNFLTGISSADGSISQAQPAFTDISGSVAASQLPNPSASTLGGVQSKAAVTSNFLTQISTSGVVSAAQPAFSDISGSIGVSQVPNLTNDSGQALTGYSSGAGTVSSSDTTLTAIQKLNGNIAALPAAPTVSTVNTTDATVTTIYTMATASDTSYTVTQTLIGRRTGGSGGSTDDSIADYAVWLVKNVGGTASVVQVSQQGYADQGNENWTLTAAASTTNVLFKVKGVANNNISWKLSSTSVSQ